MAVIDWSDPNATANGTFNINLGLDSIDVTVTSQVVSDGTPVGGTAIFDGSPVLTPENGVDEPHSYLIDFGQNVQNIGFEVFDIDAGTPNTDKGADPASWDDLITIIARDAEGNIVSLDPSYVTANYAPTDEENINGSEDVHAVETLSGDATYPDGALRIDPTAYNGAGVEGSGAPDSLRFDFPDDIASIEIIQDNGTQADNAGNIFIGNVNFQFSPGQDDVVEGTLGDDVIVAGAYVDEDGEEVDNLDSLGLPGLTDAPGTDQDYILAFEGDDFVDAGAGDDFVDGGAGDDTIEGGIGNDELRGDLGSDTIRGEEGDDTIDGGSRADTLEGGDGDDNILGGTGADTIDGGADEDTIDGGDGSDDISGGSGDDIIIDTGVESSVREVLRWNEFTSDEQNVQSFILDTEENQVTFNVNTDNSVGIQGEDDQTITTTGIITGGLNPASTTETLELETNNQNDFAEIELAFRFNVEDVSFRIAEIERNVELTVLAFDRDGNQVDVSFTDVGSDVTASAASGTLTADGGGHASNDPTASATVFVDQPIARLVIQVDGAGGTATPNVSDVFFNSIIASDDTISGGDGADTIRGGDGTDTMAGDAGDDDIFVGGRDDASGGSGDDVFAIDDTDTAQNVDATIDGGSDGTGTGTPAEPDDNANGDAGDTIDLSNLSGDANAEDGIDGVTVTYGSNPEDGTVTGVDGLEDDPDLTFTEIENIVYTDDDDVADASAATSSVTVDTAGGDDEITGGEGDDTLNGGDGNDTVFISEGSDIITGGTGEDRYSSDNSAALSDETIDVVTNNDGDATIAKEGDGGTDTTTDIEIFTADEGQTGTSGIDVIEITGDFLVSEISGIDTTNAAGTWVSNDPTVGTVSFGPGGPTLGEILGGTFDPGDGPVGPKGTFQITNGDESGQIGNVQFENFETVNFGVVCFARGTMIATAKGERSIETLSEGDLVETMDHGLQSINWIGVNKLDKIDLTANPKLLPIRIRAGALGEGLPKTDLVVSRQHRVLVRSKIVERMFNKTEVLIPAIKLVELDGIDVESDCNAVDYYHMLFDQHEIVFSNGAPTESLFTGPEALKMVSEDARREIEILFPEIMDESYVASPARFIPNKGKDMKQLVFRHQKNQKPLLQ